MYLKGLLKDKEVYADRGQDRNRLLHISEAYKTIRGNLLFSMAGKKYEKAKIVMITSGSQAEGKSSTCVNLAASFAESNARVLVIDADLRKPKVEQYITEVRKEKGLSDVLGGFIELKDAIQRPAGCNFDCLFSGSIPPNPSELLMLDTVEEMFNELAEHYDYIFVDTPPVGIVSETLYLTQYMSGVLLVVKKDSTRLKKLQEVIAALKFANANVLGFVLNASSDGQVRRYYRKEKYYYYHKPSKD